MGFTRTPVEQSIVGRLKCRCKLPAASRSRLIPGECHVHASQPNRMKRPNIIFIVADDLGFADLGCYGGRPAEFGAVSPVLDGLAADGLKFTQGYAELAGVLADAIRADDRRATSTGCAARPKSRSTARAAAARTLGLPPEHPTLPSLLKDSGYRTALIGKWHLGYPPTFGPLRSGYEEFFGPMSGGVDYFTHCSSTGAHDLWFGEDEKQEEGYLTDLISRRAVDYVDRMAGTTRAVLPQPALHRAALALGNARRRGAGAGGEGQPVPPARRQHPQLPPHDPPHGRRHRLGDGCACARPALRTTRWWSSPATTAASASPTTGRWWAARWT